MIRIDKHQTEKKSQLTTPTPLQQLPRFSSKSKIENNKQLQPKPKHRLPASLDQKAKGFMSTDLYLNKNSIQERPPNNAKDQLELNKIRKSENLSVKTKSITNSEIAKIRKSIQMQSKHTDQLPRSETKSIKVNFKKKQEKKHFSISLHKNKNQRRESLKAIKTKKPQDKQPLKWESITRTYLNRNLLKKQTVSKLVTEIQKQQTNLQFCKSSTESTDQKNYFRLFPQEEEKLQATDQLSINHIQIPYFLVIQDIHLNVYQNLKNNTAVYELCLCYINIEKVKNQKIIFTMVSNTKQAALLRNLFLYERMVVFTVVYAERQKMKKRKFVNHLIDLTFLAFKNYSILIELILEILQENNKLDTKMFKPKELDKVKKYRDIAKYNNCLKASLFNLFEKKELPMFQLFYNLLQSSIGIEGFEFVNIIDKTLKWEILKMPSYPYLPKTTKQHTLVLDLDQTLIHFDPKASLFHVRPYAEEFIQVMSKYFQVCIFTAGTKQYADQIIDDIDPNRCIAHRLYRNHITLHEGAPIKDLQKLGRDMSKIIIVDNLSSNFRQQQQNGILISSWYGQEGDEVLQKLCTVLKNIVTKYHRNLKEGLKEWSKFIREQISFNRLIYEMKVEL